LLHPAASHEVRRVSCFRASIAACRNRLLRSAGAFPTTSFTPLEEFHPTAAVPHHCGRCPLAVASVPSGHLLPVPFPVPGLDALPSGCSTSRLSSAVGSVTSARPLPIARRPILPWALFPFEVLLRTGGSLPSILASLSSRASEETCDPRRAPLHHLHTLAHMAGPIPLLSEKHGDDTTAVRSEDRPTPSSGNTWPPEGGGGASHRSSILLA